MCHVSHLTWHVSCVACHLSPVTCQMSLTPTATTMDPIPANSPSLHSRMVDKDPKIYFFPPGNLRPLMRPNFKFQDQFPVETLPKNYFFN